MSTTLVAPVEAAALEDSERAGKYLTFQLGSEEFGIPVLKIREIMGIQEITTVPQTPSWMKGVINLRGKVIPVIDLRLKFGMPTVPYNQRTCIVVAQVQTESEQILMGLVVDEVSEVVNISAGEIEDAPSFGSNVPTPYILGMAKQKGKVKILLDIDQALSSSELNTLQDVLQ